MLRLPGNVYYAYSTAVEWGRRSHWFPIIRSTDLVSWRHVGDAFRRPPAWARDRHWAPSALQHEGRTHLFYSARGRSGRHCVAMASARRPRGPFRHRAVLACGRPLGYIDPFGFVDPATGQPWLYVARADPTCHRRPGRCFIAAMPLSSDLTRVIGPRKVVLGVTEPWERRRGYETVENPYVFESGGRYYILYSGNDWRSPDYAMGYAVGPTPVGPFVKAGPPVMAGTDAVRGPGGGSLVEGPGGGLWMAYHARRRGVGDPRRRSLHLDPVALMAGELFTPGPSRAQPLTP